MKDKLRALWTQWKKRIEDQQSGFLYKGLQALENMPDLKTLALKFDRLKYPGIFIGGLLISDLLTQGTVSFFLKNLYLKGNDQPKIIKEKPVLHARSYYEPIARKNTFCPGCPIPNISIKRKERAKDCGKAPPLGIGSIKVLGTIVLSNPEYSVAILQDGSSDSKALKTGDAFGQAGKIFEIKRSRVCFEKPDGRLGFVEIPKEPVVRFGQPIASAIPSDPNDSIEAISDTELVIKRDFLMEKLDDPELLYQAHAVPERGDDGKIKCFRIKSFVPGSVYEKLIKVEDCIKSINGEPLNSIAKVQQLYASIRQTQGITMDVERGGSTVTLKYGVK